MYNNGSRFEACPVFFLGGGGGIIFTFRFCFETPCMTVLPSQLTSPNCTVVKIAWKELQLCTTKQQNVLSVGVVCNVWIRQTSKPIFLRRLRFRHLLDEARQRQRQRAMQWSDRGVSFREFRAECTIHLTCVLVAVCADERLVAGG